MEACSYKIDLFSMNKDCLTYSLHHMFLFGGNSFHIVTSYLILGQVTR